MNCETRPLIHPILICGGAGTRLWPLSRKAFPKQFAPITGQGSLFQQALQRGCGLGFARPTVVTGNRFRFLVAEQLADLDVTANHIVIEPDGRNTAPAILAAALLLAKTDPDAVLLAMPADHVIPDRPAFQSAVRRAVPSALDGKLVTFGIVPDRPETCYGYLELEDSADLQVCDPRPLLRFVEKPRAAQAEQMLASGRYLWNAGVFLFTARSMIAAFERYAPDMLGPVQDALDKATPDLGFTRLAPDPWRQLRDISIDYAIMEHASDLVAMPFHGAWSDLGGWDAIWRETEQDPDGNTLSGQATAIDCHDSLLRSENDRIELVGIGLTDMIAVATADAVLVAHKRDAQNVAKAVAALKAKGARQATEMAVDHRPWGSFERLAQGSRFQVKRIIVRPGGALSLQSHRFRAEHWIIVEGTAEVTLEDRVTMVSENQSIYVPCGARHRLRNPGNVPVVLIEVQTGSYLGEDDITRYADQYARAAGSDG